MKPMLGVRMQRELRLLIAAAMFIIAVELLLILHLTGGEFTYTLDDAYIHLALAENLARFGHYGINLQEYSSASSSIIWPFLLVPFFVVGLGAYGPLIINVFAAVGSAVVICFIIRDVGKNVVMAPNAALWPWALLLLVFLNGFGLIFTGMEHSLHVLVTLATMYIVQRKYQERQAKPDTDYLNFCLAACIVISPLIRFEGLAVSAFGILIFLLLRRPLFALFSALLLGVALTVFSYSLSSLGLSWLPSSVLVKSEAAADLASSADMSAGIVGVASQAAADLARNLSMLESWPLLAIGALIAGQLIVSRRQVTDGVALYAVGSLAVILLHLAFGRFGWYGRYQCYVYAFAVCAAMFVIAGTPGARVSRKPFVWLALFGPLAFVLSFDQSLRPLLTTPVAAQNIHGQQYQMHRFVTRYWKAPVAVNDIGYISFQNDQYVLDLWGLGSEEARRLIRKADKDLLRSLTAGHNVHLAMIYESYFLDLIPVEWQKLADLRLNFPRVTPADSRVSFYVFGISADQCLRTASQLVDFANTLPPPNSLQVYRDACSMIATADTAGLSHDP
jgi:hypothetical protein